MCLVLLAISVMVSWAMKRWMYCFSILHGCADRSSDWARWVERKAQRSQTGPPCGKRSSTLPRRILPWLHKKDENFTQGIISYLHTYTAFHNLQ